MKRHHCLRFYAPAGIWPTLTRESLPVTQEQALPVLPVRPLHTLDLEGCGLIPEKPGALSGPVSLPSLISIVFFLSKLSL